MRARAVHKEADRNSRRDVRALDYGNLQLYWFDLCDVANCERTRSIQSAQEEGTSWMMMWCSRAKKSTHQCRGGSLFLIHH